MEHPGASPDLAIGKSSDPLNIPRSIMPRSSRLSIELLQTFLSLLEDQGDALAAAAKLEINQPSMSKRLAVMQHTGRGITPGLG